MRYLARTLAAAALLAVIEAAAGHATTPYDGVWSGQVVTPEACAGSTLVLTVVEGSVSGVLRGPLGVVIYAPSKIDADGTALLVGGNMRRPGSTTVTFADDHFQIHMTAGCGTYTR
jgi:hypothetical protein